MALIFSCGQQYLHLGDSWRRQWQASRSNKIPWKSSDLRKGHEEQLKHILEKAIELENQMKNPMDSVGSRHQSRSMSRRHHCNFIKVDVLTQFSLARRILVANFWESGRVAFKPMSSAFALSILALSVQVFLKNHEEKWVHYVEKTKYNGVSGCHPREIDRGLTNEKERVRGRAIVVFLDMGGIPFFVFEPPLYKFLLLRRA
ncbi:hypothetical protein ACLOJK_032397 [Asimina triloba]